MLLSRAVHGGLLILLLAIVSLLLCSCDDENCATCPEEAAPDPTGWFVQDTPTTEALNFIHVIDARTVIASGSAGTIIRTTDGGDTWSLVSSGTSEQLRDGSFRDHAHGWICGDNGTLLETADAGATWAPVTLPVQEEMRGVAFVDELNGWVSGGPIGGATGDMVLLKTTDGGDTWDVQTTTFTMRMLWFVDADSGCAAGGNTLMRTTDGGETWDPCDPATAGWLSTLYFVDALHGWIAGGGGFVGVTTDGGRTWAAQATGTTRNVIGAHFLDANTGWYVARNPGTIAATADGGATWTFQTSPVTTNLSEVRFVDANTGWICGLDGLILKTVSAGR
jgi:photosystem II stability/assembly factor-like uncharacterized protein